MQVMKTYIKNFKVILQDDVTYIFVTKDSVYLLDTQTYQLTTIRSIKDESKRTR